jgi:hypothetical protein
VCFALVGEEIFLKKSRKRRLAPPRSQKKVTDTLAFPYPEKRCLAPLLSMGLFPRENHHHQYEDNVPAKAKGATAPAA